MLTRLPRNPIQLWVSDVEIGGTRYKQRARYRRLSLTSEDDNTTTAMLEVRVYAHAVLPDGSAGEALTLNGLPFRLVYLHVDAATSVYFDPADPTNARTGELLSLRSVTPQPAWEAGMEADALPHVIQADLFGLMMEQEQRVTLLILSELWRADQLGKFDYVVPALQLGAGL
jgi:hypothetical protein